MLQCPCLISLGTEKCFPNGFLFVWHQNESTAYSFPGRGHMESCFIFSEARCRFNVLCLVGRPTKIFWPAVKDAWFCVRHWAPVFHRDVCSVITVHRLIQPSVTWWATERHHWQQTVTVHRAIRILQSVVKQSVVFAVDVARNTCIIHCRRSGVKDS